VADNAKAVGSGCRSSERRHRMNQRGRAPAGQRGEPGKPLWGPVTDSVVDTAVLPRRADQGREVADGEVVGVGEPVQVGA
jgi:hypothetical protein